MYEDLADFSVEYLKRKCDYAEARIENTLSSGAVMKNGILEISGFEKINGLGIRFILDGALGFVTTNILEKRKIEELIKKALKKVKYKIRMNEPLRLAPDKTKKAKYRVREKIKFSSIDQRERAKLLFDAEKSLAETNIKMPSRYFSLSEDITKEYFVNSEGTTIEATIPKANFFYFLTVAENQSTSQRYWQYGGSGGWELLKKWNIQEILCEEARAMQKNLEFGIKLKKGRYDVVVGPQVTGIMVHESVGHPYEADRILGREAAQAGESFVTADMIGYKIGSSIVNVVDDPTLQNSYGFYLYDNEGVKARRKHLIKEGRINELLHNRESAACMNAESNGSSRASSYAKESIIRMSNTFMLVGDYSEEELIEDIKSGIYIKNFMEWNIDDKRLNQKYVGSEAYLIKNGKIMKPVRNPVIEISTLKLYKAIDAIGKNVEWHAANCGKGEPMQTVPVWMGGPSARFRKLVIK